MSSTFPRDKRDNTIITDPVRLDKMGWPSKLERATAKMGARFIDFDLVTGTWSFRVSHFSKYGLADSDDECDENITSVTKPGQTQNKIKLGVLPVPTLQDKGDFIKGTSGLGGGAGLGGGLGGETEATTLEVILHAECIVLDNTRLYV